MGSTSLWQSELNESGKTLSTDPLHGAVETEVAVIGAGITGTATALWLARAGIDVRVLEARSVACGSERTQWRVYRLWHNCVLFECYSALRTRAGSTSLGIYYTQS